MTLRERADLLGFLAAGAGALGAVLLAFPLFHLLRAREATEDLERALDAPGLSDVQRAEIGASLRDVRVHVHFRRKTATRMAKFGVSLLAVMLILLVWQGMLLYL